jgi:hypothetical protein
LDGMTLDFVQKGGLRCEIAEKDRLYADVGSVLQLNY